MIARAIYTAALALAAPLIVVRLLWRARRQPDYLRHLGERFGFHSCRRAGPLIWIHAVSVGETRAAQPLVKLLRRRFPGHQILLTHMTPTGRDTARKLFGDATLSAYLPYDYPCAMNRFLRHFAPDMGILMETEVWPNLVAACRRRSVPLLLVNARLSERSARRYGWLPSLARQSFGALTVAAQTAADATRLEALGARDVVVTGNVKFDILPPPEQLEAGRALRRQVGPRPVLLAASTREGEETLLLDAFRGNAPPGALLVIVPRHPQRFEAVARMVEAAGLELQRRSAREAIRPETRVLLGDSMGEMFAWYAACDVAYVGGSLLPLGGQNLIEACAVGVPVLVGPHTFNFAEATRQALECGAARRVGDAAELMRSARALLSDDARRSTMAAAGREFAARHRGAAARTVELVVAACGRRA
ncbi:MAG: lipid IV(A) 3-deoxy-D-manno-octulosonic acid transferase [Betaproteobacteria bacterium]|nr:lipid IV(A) 3-deoxy-D-manno-octulosonic acid transferase [Betaproteobacteria bacterium]